MQEQDLTLPPLMQALSAHPLLDDAWREVAKQGHGLHEWLVIAAALYRASERLNLSALSCQSARECQRVSDRVDSVSMAVAQGQLDRLMQGADAQLVRILQVAICGDVTSPLTRWEVFARLLGPVEMGRRLRRLTEVLRAHALIG